MYQTPTCSQDKPHIGRSLQTKRNFQFLYFVYLENCTVCCQYVKFLIHIIKLAYTKKKDKNTFNILQY